MSIKTQRHFACRRLKNQSGFALVLTMVMLAVLSILGVMVLNSTDTELKIASNARTSSDAFVAAELATEYAQQKVIEDPEAISSYDLIADDDIAVLLPDGIELNIDGRNEIDFYTGLAPTAMTIKNSSDAYLGNIYRSTGSASPGESGDAAYYRVSVEAKANGRSTARIETLFVNRGGQVY